MIINLHLKGKQIIIIGGGSESLRKINSFIKENAKILVISQRFNPKILSLAKQKKIIIKKMKISDGSFISEYNPFIIIAATNNSDLNKKIIHESKKQKILSYSVDDPSESDITFLSIVNIKNLVNIGISTGGKSPIITKKIRMEAEKRLNQIISDEDVFHIKIQDIARTASKSIIRDQADRRRFLYSLFKDKHIKQLIKDKKFMKAEKRALEILSEWK